MATSKATTKSVGKARQPKTEPVPEPKSNAGKSAISVSCSICGKPLTDAESIEAGVGPVCQHKGWTPTQIAERLDELTLKKEPDQKYIALSEIVRAAVAVGISPSRVVRAIGGDRGMDAPLSPTWTPRYYNGRRYLLQKVLGQLDELREMPGRQSKVKTAARANRKAAEVVEAPRSMPKLKPSKKVEEPVVETGPVKSAKKAPAKPAPKVKTFGGKTLEEEKPAPKAKPTVSTTRAKAPVPAPKPAGKRTEKGFGYVAPAKTERKVSEDGLPVIDL